MATMRPLVRRLKGNRGLTLALWDAGGLEARMLAALVDDPAAVTAAARWIGRDAARELASAPVQARLARRG